MGEEKTVDKTVDYISNKVGCTVTSPLKHIDIVGHIVQEAVYNFLVDTGDRLCICNKQAIWKLPKGCNGKQNGESSRKSLYAKVPKGYVTVYLNNGKVAGRLVHVGNFEIVVEVSGEEYFIHKDLIVALCWPK